jgi:hypothetical protein
MPKNDFIAWYRSDSNDGEKARFCTGLQEIKLGQKSPVYWLIRSLYIIRTLPYVKMNV